MSVCPSDCLPCAPPQIALPPAGRLQIEYPIGTTAIVFKRPPPNRRVSALGLPMREVSDCKRGGTCCVVGFCNYEEFLACMNKIEYRQILEIFFFILMHTYAFTHYPLTLYHLGFRVSGHRQHPLAAALRAAPRSAC